MLPLGGATGVYSNRKSSERFDFTEPFQFRVDKVGSGTPSHIRAVSWEYATDDGSCIIGWHTATPTVVGGSSKRYLIPFNNQFETSETRARLKIPFACVASRLIVRTNAVQPADGDMTITIFKGGVAQTLVGTVTANTNNTFYYDFTNTASFSAGDELSIEVDNTSTSNSATLSFVMLKLLPSNPGTTCLVGCNINNNIAAGGVTNYIGLFGFTAGATATQFDFPMPRAGILDDVSVFVDNGAGAFSATFTIQKNGVDQSLTAVAAQGSGASIRNFTGDPVTYARGDLFRCKIVYGVAGAGTTAVRGLCGQYLPEA